MATNFPELPPPDAPSPGRHPSPHWGTVIGIGIGDVLQRPDGMWAILAAFTALLLALTAIAWIGRRR
ncbi:hypothetical protein [Kitasatospora sp. NPDC057500]|uniref:hypothetical protein n=1 Tax=Kitasatospora sp. NPDC057500 TaxID=3346151 RepID=UPI0036A78D73